MYKPEIDYCTLLPAQMTERDAKGYKLWIHYILKQLLSTTERSPVHPFINACKSVTACF